MTYSYLLMNAGALGAIAFIAAVVSTAMYCASNCTAPTIYNVTNTNNSGTGSLRQAITDMNNAGLQLNSSGQGSVLASFDRDQVFQGLIFPGGPFPFTIDTEDRLVATTTSGAGTTEFSALSYPTLPGDYNLNGSVDASDYIIWRKNDGKTNALYTQGDGNFDGVVDQADYDVWRSHYGQTP